MSKPKIQAASGASLVLLSSAFYASYGIWSKLIGSFLGGYGASMLRSILVIVLLLPVAYFCKSLGRLDLKRNWRNLTGLLLGSLFTWGPLYYAINTAGVGVSLTVNYASIVLGTFLFGWLIAGEKFTRSKAMSSVLGIAGLAMIYAPGIHSALPLPLLAATVSGLSIGANTIFVKRIRYSTLQSALALWTTSVIANMLMVLLSKETLPAFTGQTQWYWLIPFAVASAVASWTFTSGLKRLDAGIASLLGLTEVAFAVLFGVILFHERPGVIVVAGIVTVILAIALPYRDSLQLSDAARSDPQ